MCPGYRMVGVFAALMLLNGQLLRPIFKNLLRSELELRQVVSEPPAAAGVPP